MGLQIPKNSWVEPRRQDLRLRIFFELSLFESQKVTQKLVAVIQASNWLTGGVYSMFSSQFDFLSLISAKIRRISLVPHELAEFFTPRLRLKKPPVSKATASRLGVENNALLRVRSLLGYIQWQWGKCLGLQIPKNSWVEPRWQDLRLRIFFELSLFESQKVTQKLRAPVFTSNRWCFLQDRYWWTIGFLALLQT